MESLVRGVTLARCLAASERCFAAAARAFPNAVSARPWAFDGVEVRGFEPLTSSVRGRRSAGLSYTPMASGMDDTRGDLWAGQSPAGAAGRPALTSACLGLRGRPHRAHGVHRPRRPRTRVRAWAPEARGCDLG